eukprot:1813100-Rhodomonas_salina.2
MALAAGSTTSLHEKDDNNVTLKDHDYNGGAVAEVEAELGAVRPDVRQRCTVGTAVQEQRGAHERLDVRARPEHWSIQRPRQASNGKLRHRHHGLMTRKQSRLCLSPGVLFVMPMVDEDVGVAERIKFTVGTAILLVQY